MKNLPLVSAIIINWNGEVALDKCLYSLIQINYPKEKIEIIVVDNGSTDKSVSMVQSKYPTVNLISLKNNMGAPYAFNEGARIAKGTYVFKLDNDVIFDNEYLMNLVNIIDKNEKIGIVGGKILYYDSKNTLWFVYGSADLNNGVAKNYGKDEVDKNQYNTQKSVDYVSGCALLVRKELLDRVNNLNADYFIYYDETELCVKIKKLGYDVIYVPEAKVWHMVSSSLGRGSNKSEYYLRRNRMFFLKRNGTWKGKIFAYLMGLGLIAFSFPYTNSEKKFRFKAGFDFLTNKVGKQL